MLACQLGTWGETVAAAWLMKNEYEVFVALGNASCDLIAVRDGLSQRVEVKVASAYKGAKGKFSIAGVVPDKHDMLMVIMPNGDVVINPSGKEIYGAEPPQTRTVACRKCERKFETRKANQKFCTPFCKQTYRNSALTST